MSATNYVNAVTPFHCPDCKKTPYVKDLGFIDILAVCEKVVVDRYLAEQAPYLALLTDPDERVAYVRQIQVAQPRDKELQILAMDEILSDEGIDAILRFGLLECNPEMDIDGFMEVASVADKDGIFSIFCKSIHDAGKRQEKKEAAKRTRKKSTARTKAKKP